MATGIRVKGDFNPVRPGRELRAIIDKAEQACNDLRHEGIPLNEVSLRNRIRLMLDGYHFSEDRKEVSIWMKGKAEIYTLEGDVNTVELERAITQEMSKASPNLKDVISNHVEHGKNEIFGFWEQVIKGEIQGKKRNTKFAPATISTKKQVMNLVKQFRPNLTFAQMDRKFYNEFVTWLNDENYKPGIDTARKKTGAYEPNQVGKCIKELKAILTLAKRNDIDVNNGYTEWDVERVSNPTVSLTKDEVEALMNLELKGTQKDIRDLFVMGCFLGPRIGDYHKMTKPDNYYTDEEGILTWGDSYEKTGTLTDVPIMRPLQEFMKEMLPILSGNKESNLPKMISEQNFRNGLKQVAKKAGLNRIVTVKIDGDNNAVKLRLHEAITPHHSKRTFATSLYYGWWAPALPANDCMEFTGHKSEKVFLHYIGATAKEKRTRAIKTLGLEPIMKAS